MTIQPSKNTQITLHKIYSEDALELDAILFAPVKKTDTIVLHVHGKEGHFLQNHFVTNLGYTLPQYGFAFLTFNNRGHDYIADMLRKTHSGFEFVTRGSAHDQVSEAPKDINGVIKYCQNLGFERIILQGHSLGPHKICYYLANKPLFDIAGVILLSGSDILYLLDAYVPDWLEHRQTATDMIAAGHGDQLMPINIWSNAPVSANSYFAWTKDDSDTWIFNYSRPSLPFKYFDQIRQPILNINPKNDFGVNTDQTTISQMLKDRTISTDFQAEIIPNSPHNFSQSEKELTIKIIRWLSERY